MREPNSPEPSDHDDVPDLVDDEPTAAAVTSADEDAQETRNETDKTQRPQSALPSCMPCARGLSWAPCVSGSRPPSSWVHFPHCSRSGAS